MVPMVLVSASQRAPAGMGGGKEPMAGFTLIEVVVAVAISLILIGMGASNIGGILQATRERNDVNDLQEYLLEARSLARNQASAVTVLIKEHTLFVEAEPEVLRSYTLGAHLEDVKIHTSEGTLTFNARGGTTEAGPVTVSAATDGGKQHVFTIYPAIGSIRRGEDGNN